jgi:hypothetical protein
MDDENKALYMKELKVLKEAHHPFLIEYIDDFEYQKQEFCIITKFAKEGNLKTLMKKKKMIGFTEKKGTSLLSPNASISSKHA